MTINYETSAVGQNGVATAHMLPAATLAQYGRHYSQAMPGYNVHSAPWVTTAPYLVQTPPHLQQVDVSFSITSKKFFLVIFIFFRLSLFFLLGIGTPHTRELLFAHFNLRTFDTFAIKTTLFQQIFYVKLLMILNKNMDTVAEILFCIINGTSTSFDFFISSTDNLKIISR